MAHLAIYLLAITLSSADGSEISREIKDGPFPDVQACSAEAVKTGTQHPANGTITVYQCGVQLDREKQG